MQSAIDDQPQSGVNRANRCNAIRRSALRNRGSIDKIDSPILQQLHNRRTIVCNLSQTHTHNLVIKLNLVEFHSVCAWDTDAVAVGLGATPHFIHLFYIRVPSLTRLIGWQ